MIDLSQFTAIEDVPILDEHELKDDDGNVIMKVDGKKLREIAEKNNRRIRETGDYAPVVIGHTDDDAPEKDQPEWVGLAGDYKVKKLAKSGRDAIHATFYVRRGKEDRVREFPRRSVELWLSDWKIDPIALLGATTPERDLGLLQFSDRGKRYYRHMYQADPGLGAGPPSPAGAPGGQQDLVAQIIGALEQTDVFQWVKQQMAQEQAMDMGQGLGPDPMAGGMDSMAGGMPPMPPGPPGPPPGDGFEDDGYEEKEDDEDEEERPVKKSAISAPAFPSGSNTHMPSNRPRQMSRPAYQGISEYDRIRLAQASQRLQYSRMAQAMQAMARDNEALRLKYERSERERDLVQLEAEGYLFDAAEELQEAEELDLTPEGWQKQVERIRKNYQKAPVGRIQFSAHTARAAQPATGSKAQGMTRERMHEISAYAAKNGLSFEDAWAKLDGK